MTQNIRYSAPQGDSPVEQRESLSRDSRLPDDQGSTKTAPRHQCRGEVVEGSVNSWPSMTREDKVDVRILSILSQPSYSRYLGWSWTGLRQRIGGKVRAVEFREAIERLLVEGEVVEFWMQSNGPEPTHRLVLARYSKFIDPASLLTIRGNRNLVDKFAQSMGVDEFE